MQTPKNAAALRCLTLVLCVLLLLQSGACAQGGSGGAAGAPGQEKPTTAATPSAASIGTATMGADGTIVLDLRAEGPGQATGDALLVYPRGHAKYDEILRHLGGLRPGERKAVPSWPEPASAVRWLGTFTVYPGARELCTESVVGNIAHINWSAYATADATADVVDFYARTEAKDRVPAADESLRVSRGDRSLMVYSASATTYPRCGVSPLSEDKTVIIVAEVARQR